MFVDGARLKHISITIWKGHRWYLLRDVVDAFDLDLRDPKTREWLEDPLPMLRFDGDREEGLYVDHFLHEVAVAELAALSPRSKAFVAQELTTCLYGVDDDPVAVPEEVVEELGLLKRRLPRSWPDSPRFEAKLRREIAEAVRRWNLRRSGEEE